jgi:hypothetical protein
MPKNKVIVGTFVTSVISTLVLVGNFEFSTRDQILTSGLESFVAEDIVSNRLWVESPIQIIHTYMGNTTRFLGVGVPGMGGLPFAERLKRVFGEDQVDQSEPPIDLRQLPPSELAVINEFVQRFSYRSVHPCPHNLNQKCTIAVGWNRARTREKNMTMLVTRVSETLYLILDDSLLSVSEDGA